ncbi:protein-tyrosine-phosphatase [uncultured Nonlabens sp.]|uniref:protein-tyrosine-phosphatase n=1 Tax=uncultured Nonlabens sp. TaxID=859306 RepID=UPI0026241D6F|nr:protein-tyrosine-phosphatase [uncultured Nonlabens sp.]
MTFTSIENTINTLDTATITEPRKKILAKLSEYIQQKVNQNDSINLNFICTHNSRRSHLGQIWAQTLANFYQIENLKAYSGGTEATAVFPKIVETVKNQGFQIEVIEEGKNPLYTVYFDEDCDPVLCFSKIYDDIDNPESDFAAVMTCDSANEGCPFIPGANQRVAVTYEDPKNSDGTPQQDEVYRLKSLEIATELKYVFSQIK